MLHVFLFSADWSQIFMFVFDMSPNLKARYCRFGGDCSLVRVMTCGLTCSKFTLELQLVLTFTWFGENSAMLHPLLKIHSTHQKPTTSEIFLFLLLFFSGPRCLPHSGHYLVYKQCLCLKLWLTAQETTHSTLGQQPHTV